MTGDLAYEDPERLERALGRVLLWGVRVSASLLGAGLAVTIVAGPSSQASNALLNAGLVVLMATPMLRVLVSFVEYLRKGDWLFILTTLAVIAILGASLVAAFIAA